MADVETPAESSTPTSPQAEASVPTDPEAYAEWRQTGKLPEKSSQPSKKEDSAPSISAGEKPEKAAPVSETGSKRQHRDNADDRKAELNREIQELLAHRNQLRREVELTGKTDVKAEPSPAPEADDSKRPVKPKLDDYRTLEEYDTAQDKYLEALTDWKTAKRIEEHETRRREEDSRKEMQVRLDEAKSRYGEEAEPRIVDTARTVFSDQKVAPAIKHALGRSDVLVDALYVMGSDQAELDSFVKLAQSDPLEALRKWFVVEGLVREELGKAKSAAADRAPPRATDGKFVSEKLVRKEAPAPPIELNGNSSPPGDETERAANAGDFRRFKQERDRRDSARFRGQI